MAASMPSMAAASSGGDFAGDIADAVGALHHGDPAFGQGAAVPLLERQRLQPHHQPQQPHVRAVSGFGCAPRQSTWSSMAASVAASVTRRATRSITRICSAIHLAAPERLPHGGQAVGESGGCGRPGSAPGRAAHARS